MLDKASPHAALSNSQAEESVSDAAPLFVVDTAFDFRLKENSSTTGRYNEKDPGDQFSYTQTQRISAQQALKTTSLKDLRQKVSLFLNFCVNSILSSDCSLTFLGYTTARIW